MILRGASEQRRPADVDLLNDLRVGLGFVGGRLRERIHIHRDDIDRRDLQCLRLGEIVAIVPAQQDPAHDVGMQGLHPSAEAFGKSRDVLDRNGGNAFLPQEGEGAARGEDLVAQRGETLRERGQSGLIRDGNEGALGLGEHGGGIVEEGIFCYNMQILSLRMPTKKTPPKAMEKP